MASYQPQILDAPPQYGFLPGFAGGLSKGMGQFSDLYGQSVMKDFFSKKDLKNKQEAISKFMAAMQEDPNMEMETVSMDESGNPKYTFKRKESIGNKFSKDPLKAIKHALLGIGTEETGQAMGIQPQQPMAQDIMSQIFPVGQMTGQKINAQGGRLLNYDDTVKKSLMEQYAPGYTPEQITRETMGLPIETPQEKLLTESKRIPESFTNDIQNLKNLADGNSEIFVAGLEKLSLKYTDNPDALKRIKLIRSIFSGEEPFVPDDTLLE